MELYVRGIPRCRQPASLRGSVQAGGLVEQVVEGVDLDIAVRGRDEFARAVCLPSLDARIADACDFDPSAVLIGEEEKLEAGRFGVEGSLLAAITVLGRR